MARVETIRDGYRIQVDGEAVTVITETGLRRVLRPGITVTPYGDAFLLDEAGQVFYRKYGETTWHGISFKQPC